MAAAAALVQIYTGLIYKGPALVAEIAEALASPPATGSAALSGA
jgi:dihydroorotate dehydrogenase